MKRISFLLVFHFTAVAWGQLMTGSAAANGVSFSYETRLEPPDPPISKIGGGSSFRLIAGVSFGLDVSSTCSTNPASRSRIA